MRGGGDAGLFVVLQCFCSGKVNAAGQDVTASGGGGWTRTRLWVRGALAPKVYHHKLAVKRAGRDRDARLQDMASPVSAQCTASKQQLPAPPVSQTRFCSLPCPRRARRVPQDAVSAARLRRVKIVALHRHASYWLLCTPLSPAKSLRWQCETLHHHLVQERYTIAAQILCAPKNADCVT